MTALGLIATLAYATSAPTLPVVLICLAIGVIGCITIWVQVRHAMLKLIAEEETVEAARPIFTALEETRKEGIHMLVTLRNIPQNSPAYGSLAGLESTTPFISRDFTSGAYGIHPNYLSVLPRLAKEWHKQTLSTKPTKPATQPQI